MSRISKYINRILGSEWIPVIGLGSASITCLAMAGLLVYAEIKASHPKPPIYRDVNGDGVEDKIIQRRVLEPAGLFMVPNLEEKVLYGIDINGRRIYLPEEQFNGLER